MKLFLRWDRSSGDLDLIKAGLSQDWEVLELPKDAPADELKRVLAQADACIAGDWPRSMPPAPKLKLLQVTGTGYDGVDLSALPAGCTLCNVFEHEGAIAEYLVLAMLEWQIGLRRMDAALRQGVWAWGHPHGRLEGKTVGFIGYGHIARETAARLAAFGVRVIARTRRPETADAFAHAVAGMDQLGSLLAEADFVVVCCPLNPASRGLIGAKELGKMKASAVLINVARGPVVDEDALYEACRSRSIAGAVLDVWYKYPKGEGPSFPSRHPFQDLDNILMTPHASAEVDDLVRRRCGVMVENLNRLAKGEPLLNVVRF
jgi:phosphoglycerate dehydrogenase-like enzyme